MLRKLISAVGLVALGSAMAFGRPGTVVTKDGRDFTGDIKEQADSVDISGIPGTAGPMNVKLANVVTISYKVDDEVRAALKKLGPRDVATRINLAKAAIQAHAYLAARDALREAASIDPNNTEVPGLMSTVLPLLPPPATEPTAVPATKPSTPDATSAPATPKPVDAGLLVKRPITPAEINKIRQVETSFDSGGAVRVRIEADAKRRFLASYPDITPAEFNHLSADKQAELILDKGKDEQKAGVQILNDPPSVLEFQKTANRVLTQSCGLTTGCHSGTKAGPFTLATGNSSGSTYTNFWVLQRYAYPDKDGLHPLIDRGSPEDSLLLQYMLPKEAAAHKHPDATGFRSAVKTKSDPRYVQILNWIQNLKPITPDYGIDLSKEPPKAEKPDKAAAAK